MSNILTSPYPILYWTSESRRKIFMALPIIGTKCVQFCETEKRQGYPASPIPNQHQIRVVDEIDRIYERVDRLTALLRFEVISQ